MTIENWNEAFGLDGQVTFSEGNGGLTKVDITNSHATAEIYLFGAQVLQFTPVGKKPLFWTSPNAVFNGSKAIRGGIPICWPWFNAHPTDTNLPSHGFARNREWSIQSSESQTDGSTSLYLGLRSDETTLALFPHEFRLTLHVHVGQELKVELEIQNTGNNPFTSGTALHTYFAVDNIAQTKCAGLENVEFVDNMDNASRKREDIVFGFNQELERIYIDSDETALLSDGNREVQIAKSGSRSTIVWNPWIDKAKAMGDCNDDGYKEFVCVETGNVGQDVRQIAPGSSHTISQFVRAQVT